MYPILKTELPQESKTPHPLKILKYPDKKLYSLSRNPLRKPYKALEKYQPSRRPPPQKKTIPLNKLNFNTREKILTPPEKISPLSEKSQPP